MNSGGEDPSAVLSLGVLVGLLAVAGGLFALKEHQATLRDGRRLRIGPGDLAAVLD